MNSYLTIDYQPQPSIMKAILDKHGKVDIETISSATLTNNEVQYLFATPTPSFTPKLGKHICLAKPNYEYIFDIHLECILCAERVKDGEKIRVLKCKHQFHSNCLETWLTKYNNNCPVCRETNI